MIDRDSNSLSSANDLGGMQPETRDGPTRPAATKAGAWRIIAFFLLISTLAFALDQTISTGLRGLDSSAFGVWNKIIQGRINADILVVGSSRALNHYDPSVITKTTGISSFNIGLNGAQIDMQLARLKTYLKYNKKPKILIYNLDLFTFQLSHGEVYDPGQYIPYLRESSLFEALKKVNPDIWKSKTIPLYGYAVDDLRFHWLRGIAALFGWKSKEDHPFGFNPRYTAWTKEFDAFSEKNQSGVFVKVEADGVGALEGLAQLCAEQGIRLIFVYSPEFLAMQKLTANRAEIFEQYGAIASRYQLQMWDYSADPISSAKENFYNSQHLNAAGAARFSESLATKLSAQFGALASIR
jgi:hypothetical protein